MIDFFWGGFEGEGLELRCQEKLEFELFGDCDLDQMIDQSDNY